MTRRLATLQKVADIQPIPNADSIEAVQIGGWWVVSRKGIHKVGDTVVYYEIDSFLPAADKRYESLGDVDGKKFITWNGKLGFRLKTIRLRGQVSQGFILSLKEEDGTDRFPEITDRTEDTDVTELLKIEKWEPQGENANNNGSQGGGRAGNFPSFVIKTDQERIQNYSRQIAGWLTDNFQATVKKDGSSMTVAIVWPDSTHYKEALKLSGFVQDESLGARFKRFLGRFFDKYKEVQEPVILLMSRNVLLKLDGDSNFHKALKKYNVIDALKKCTLFAEDLDGTKSGLSIAVQGELIAPDIQGNYEKVQSVEWHVFDILDIEQHEYFLPNETLVSAQHFGFPHVSVIASGKLADIIDLKEGEDAIQKILAYAEGAGDNQGVKREGLVFKSHTNAQVSFKAISNSYLLKKKD